MNRELAAKILNDLIGQGVQTLCLCPGGRNAPFVDLLEEDSPFEVISFFDERSAGFFACGRIKRDGNPVAVLTTSGTAVSELLSPVIEAWYSRLPLIVVTSDRPRRLRGSGAPQAIDQTEIFGSHVEKFVDISSPEDWDAFEFSNKPYHINVCFDEPLLGGETLISWEKALENKKKKTKLGIKPSWNLGKCLCVVGSLSSDEQGPVLDWLKTFKGPIFLEATSGLRGSERELENVLTASDRMVQELLKMNQLDSVLRLGDVPLGRYWRDFDHLKFPVYSVSSKPWPGIENGQVIYQDLENMDLDSLEFLPWQNSELEILNSCNMAKGEEVNTLFARYPLAEASLISCLQNFQENAHSIYLGNSLPIRHWDLASTKSTPLYFNRGANGIDGQLSSAFGCFEPGKMHWALFGDLTTLYDMSAFWLTSKMRQMDVGLNLFIVNNFGGQIFSKMFSSPLFRNEHSIRFQKLAEMWGWSYQSWENGVEDIPLSGLNLIEIVPDKIQEESFQKEYEGIWK